MEGQTDRNAKFHMGKVLQNAFLILRNEERNEEGEERERE